MDDISGIIERVMSQPEAMEQLQSMAKQLGLGGEVTEAPPKEVSPELLSKVVSAFSEASAKDEVTSFLEALRGLLRPERQEKLDRAIRAVHLMRTARTMSSVVEL